MGIKDVTVRNVEIFDAILPPGVIRCNETIPCTGFVFQNVKAHGWWSWLGLTYFTENVHGVVTDSTPAPKFITSEGDGFVESDSQYVMVRDAVEYIHSLIFGDKKDINTQFFAPNYGAGFKKASRGFRDLYVSFTNN